MYNQIAQLENARKAQRKSMDNNLKMYENRKIQEIWQVSFS